MAIGANLAGVARVSFEASTGEFNRDIAQAEARYSQTTGRMSDDALRLGIAQDRLRRSLARYGPESKQAAAATLALRAAQRQGAVESGRLSNEMGRAGRAASHAGRGFSVFRRDVDRAAAGAVLGTRAFHGLRQGLLLGGSSLLGGFGATFALEKVLSAAKEAQVAQGQLRVALKNTGNSWGQYGAQVTDALDKQTRASAFTNDQLASSLAGFVRRFGDVNEALRANALAAEVARGKNQTLAKSQDQVLRASFGNPRAARALGIEVTKVTTSYDHLKATTQRATTQQVAFAKAADTASTRTQILAAIQERYHGNAARFLTTSAGKQALFNAELRHSEEIIGGALLPAFNQILGSLSKYLERMTRTGRLQRDVNQAVKTGTAVVGGLKAGLKGLHDVLVPLNRILGGTKSSVQLLGAAFVGMKLAAAAKGLGIVAGAERSVGTSAVIATGKVSGLRGALGGLAGINPIVIPIVLAVAAERAGHGDPLGIVSLLRKGGSPTDFLFGPKGHRGVLGNALFGGDEQAAGKTRTITRVNSVRGPGGDSGYRNNPANRQVRNRAAAAAKARAAAPPGDPTVIPLAIQQLLADAGLTPKDQSDDRKALVAERDYIRRQLATAKLTALQRIQLTQQLASDLGGIQGIDDQAAAAAQAAADKARRKREAAARKRREAARRAQAAAERERRQERARRERGIRGRILGFEGRLVKAEATPENNDDLAVLEAERRYLTSEIKNKELQLSFRQSLEAKRLSVDRRLNTLRKKTGKATGLQAQAFLDALSGDIRQFASNVGKGGQGSTVIVHQDLRGREVSQFAAAREVRRAARHVLL